MSFLAKLSIDGEELNILDCSFTFQQDVDYTNRPSAKPRGGQISVLIESNSKTDLLDWMISPTQTKSGEIVFYRRDNMSSLKKLEFVDAYCVEYTERFNSVDSSPLQIHMVLSAKEVKVKGATFVNNWPSK